METMRIEFTKAHATGNDFVVVADPEGALELSPDQVARLCDRRFGVGGDGLIRAAGSECAIPAPPPGRHRPRGSARPAPAPRPSR